MSSPVKVMEKTSNVKLGKISATYASQSSCPKTCPFYNNGCYAESGPIFLSVTRKLNASEETDPNRIADEEAKGIDSLSGVRPLRIHTLGDCTTDYAAKTVSDAAGRYMKRGGKRAFSYTHSWKSVKRKSWGKVSILASCETPEQVKAARKRGYATAIVVDEFKDTKAYEIDGVKVIPCPAQTREGTTCERCGLCQRDTMLKERELTIAFAAHGARTNTVKRKLISLKTV